MATEADTQFGITEKRFRFRDVSAYLADDFKFSSETDAQSRRALGVVRLAGGEERFHRQLRSVACHEFRQSALRFRSARARLIRPAFSAVDTAVAATTKADTKHTLNGQDLNNFAPRFGFAFSPFSSNRLVFRGGYGIFFDRPSAAFINTIFSNYPFLREEEVTFPASNVPLTTAWSQQDPTFPFNRYLPNRIVRTAGANGTYQLRDGTLVTKGADGTPNPTTRRRACRLWAISPRPLSFARLTAI